MIKAFISRVGEGKTTCAIAECLAQENKRVAFITTELSTRQILNKAKAFENKSKSFVVFDMPASAMTPLNFYKKVQKMSEEFDVIYIDCLHFAKGVNLQKLNDSCFGNFMNQCTELWIGMQANREIVWNDLNLVKQTEIEGLLSIKKICRKIKNNFFPNNVLIEAIDLETRETKIYNFTNLFKN